MASDMRAAERQFEENLRLFGQTDAEKMNLYRGLANLAVALAQLRAEVAALRMDVHKLTRD
jgi:uncharacterized membrane protein